MQAGQVYDVPLSGSQLTKPGIFPEQRACGEDFRKKWIEVCLVFSLNQCLSTSIIDKILAFVSFDDCLPFSQIEGELCCLCVVNSPSLSYCYTRSLTSFLVDLSDVQSYVAVSCDIIDIIYSCLI